MILGREREQERALAKTLRCGEERADPRVQLATQLDRD